jgi:predicted secreted protein
MKNMMGKMDLKGWYAAIVLTLSSLLIPVSATDCNSQTFEKSVKVNTEFSIALDSNPTTGYKWEVSFDKAFLRLITRGFKRPAKALLGAGGTETFVFLPLKEGETEIRLVYKRPWEKGIGQEKTFRVQISR